MSHIDWSKAPEGATHYSPAVQNFECESFWRAENGKLVEFWGKYSDGVWSHLINRRGYAKAIEDCIPRPAAWSGKGQPPVGTLCEVLNRELDNPEWEKCTILFSGKHRILYESESCSERVGYIEYLDFRPIRTPEQLAAERRALAIKRAANLCAFPSADHTFVILEALYDNGLLKGSGDQ